MDGNFLLLHIPTHFAIPISNVISVTEFELGQLKECKRMIKEYNCKKLGLKLKNSISYISIIMHRKPKVHVTFLNNVIYQLSSLHN